MIRSVAAVLAAGLLLCACGSVSGATAMIGWVHQSKYESTNRALLVDVRHTVRALSSTSISANDLHTVCGVLDEESEQANSSLPTPDDQATTLLSKAYNTLGDGAVLCYTAAADPAKRAKALVYLTRATGYLSEASARVASAMAP